MIQIQHVDSVEISLKEESKNDDPLTFDIVMNSTSINLDLEVSSFVPFEFVAIFLYHIIQMNIDNVSPTKISGEITTSIPSLATSLPQKSTAKSQSATKIPTFLKEMFSTDQDDSITTADIDGLEIADLTPIQMQDLYNFLLHRTSSGSINNPDNCVVCHG